MTYRDLENADAENSAAGSFEDRDWSSAPGDGWPSTPRSAPSFSIGAVWSTQCRSDELAEVQGRGRTICVKSPSSPPQTKERTLERPHGHSSVQPQKTKGAASRDEVGETRQAREAWVWALPSTASGKHSSLLPWRVSGICL